jgi:hypothetical protein
MLPRYRCSLREENRLAIRSAGPQSSVSAMVLPRRRVVGAPQHRRGDASDKICDTDSGTRRHFQLHDRRSAEATARGSGRSDRSPSEASKISRSCAVFRRRAAAARSLSGKMATDRLVQWRRSCHCWRSPPTITRSMRKLSARATPPFTGR